MRDEQYESAHNATLATRPATQPPATAPETTTVVPPVGTGSVGSWSAPRVFRPGWPLTALFLLFPLWWVVGLTSFAFIIFAVPLAVELLRRRDLRVPRGFGTWLLFLAWMLAGTTMLWSDAPTGEPGGAGAGRLMVFAFRTAMYLAATVFLLYVVNTGERRLPTRRVLRLLAFMFVVTTCGGLLGVAVPTLEFRSVLELVLPHGLASNGFINPMIHPAAAENQNILGYEEGRPIAPFAFANSWGANYSLYLPFFLLAWFGPEAGWRRRLAPFVLLLSLVPVVYSLNRGLWGALGVGVLYLAFRLAAMGRVWALQAVVAALLLGAIAFVVSPLGTMVQARLNAPHSNERRGQLAADTVRNAVEGSPILGFGSTRNVRGSYFSIAGGSTPDCPACGVPPLGTQGLLWMVIFSQGVVGLGLFLYFFARRFFAHWHDHAGLSLAGCVVLIFWTIELFVYDTVDAPLVTVMIAVGLMARMPRSERRVAGAR